MAHILDLPGCFVRAEDQNQALPQLPKAIHAYRAWLVRHNEEVSFPFNEVQIEIEEVVYDIGPFDPGDAAALFSPEKKSLSTDELEYNIRLLLYSRQDLLSLVSDLSNQVLDWVASEGAFSIRRLLRHVGNAEEWYVSRLVAPDTLPPEWEHDENLPIFEFLEMERRTAIERLRQLSPQERTNIYYPSLRTKHPKEAWTARKVMRRFLEHE